MSTWGVVSRGDQLEHSSTGIEGESGQESGKGGRQFDFGINNHLDIPTTTPVTVSDEANDYETLIHPGDKRD
jgi:hypothetical protein